MRATRTPTLALLSAIVLIAPGVFAAAAPAGAQAAPAQKPAGYEPGEKWQTTTSMQMMGMSMPGQSTEVCVPKNSDQSPIPLDKNCKVLDEKRSGNKITSRMVCTGKDAMEGTMEIVYDGPGHYRGKMAAKSADGEITMNYEGRKLPGECDAGEIKRKTAAAEARANAQIAQSCKESAQDALKGYPLFTGATPMCKDPKDRQVFCASVQGYRGFGMLAQQERLSHHDARQDLAVRPLTDSAKSCGFDVEARRSELCRDAERKHEWKFFANECPALATVLARRECAGRNDSNPPAAEYREFCLAYSQAGRQAGGGGSSPEPAASGSSAERCQDLADGEKRRPGDESCAEESAQKKSMSDKAKDSMKKLKGLLGR